MIELKLKKKSAFQLLKKSIGVVNTGESVRRGRDGAGAGGRWGSARPLAAARRPGALSPPARDPAPPATPPATTALGAQVTDVTSVASQQR